MKNNAIAMLTAVSFFAAGMFVSFAFRGKQIENEPGYLLEHESSIGKEEPAPHNGGGMSTAYSFFSKSADSKLVFRKRVLHQGAAIGYHLQSEEEIYYIAGGIGEMTVNGNMFTVQAGDAVLTFPGSSHGLQQTGTQDLIVIINYERK